MFLLFFPVRTNSEKTFNTDHIAWTMPSSFSNAVLGMSHLCSVAACHTYVREVVTSEKISSGTCFRTLIFQPPLSKVNNLKIEQSTFSNFPLIFAEIV